MNMILDIFSCYFFIGLVLCMALPLMEEVTVTNYIKFILWLLIWPYLLVKYIIKKL